MTPLQQPLEDLALDAEARLDLPHPRRLTPQEACLHIPRVEPAFGDFYGVCSCGAISLAMSSAVDAWRWQCPRDLAEADVLYARQRFIQALRRS